MVSETSSGMVQKDPVKQGLTVVILLTIPLDWSLPFESRSEYSAVIGSLTKDGGQRLLISNRLYPVVQDMDVGGLSRSWQDFWK